MKELKFNCPCCNKQLIIKLNEDMEIEEVFEDNAEIIDVSNCDGLELLEKLGIEFG